MPWKPSTSTSLRNGWRTSRAAPPSCGGIFDFDAKKLRLSEVAKLTEDPDIWNDPQRAQELGKERKTLESVVGTLERLGAGVRDAKELFQIAREESDDATLTSVHDDAALLERTLSPWGVVRIRRYYRTPLRNLLPFRQAGAAVFVFEVRPQSLRDAR